MGKGLILSGGEQGIYRVKLIYNRDRLDKLLADLAEKKAVLEEKKDELEAERNDVLPDHTDAIAALNEAIGFLQESYEQLSVWQAQVSDLNMELEELQQELSNDQNENDFVFEQRTAIEQEYPDTYEDREDWQELQQQWTVGESNIDALQNEIDEKTDTRDALNDDIGDLNDTIKDQQADVEEKEKIASDLAFDIEMLDGKIAALDINITAIEKRIDELESTPPADRTVDAVCADYTETLSGYVGMIDVPGHPPPPPDVPPPGAPPGWSPGPEGPHIIQPGYGGNAAYDPVRDGQLFPTLGMTAAQVFYNFAMLPGRQKWRPIFRLGWTTETDSGSALAVTLDKHPSRAQGLDIEQANTLTNVPIDYMSCEHNDAMFPWSWVVVQFDNHRFENPRIIGFAGGPRPCEVPM